MNPETLATIAGIGHALIAFVFPPWLMFGIYRRGALKRWMPPMAVAVGVAWFMRVVFRVTIEVPLYTVVAREKGNDMYDGVGGNVATLLMGWCGPLIACLFFVGLMRIIKRNQKTGTADAENGAETLGDERAR